MEKGKSRSPPEPVRAGCPGTVRATHCPCPRSHQQPHRSSRPARGSPGPSVSWAGLFSGAPVPTQPRSPCSHVASSRLPPQLSRASRPCGPQGLIKAPHPGPHLPPPCPHAPQGAPLCPCPSPAWFVPPLTPWVPSRPVGGLSCISIPRVSPEPASLTATWLCVSRSL